MSEIVPVSNTVSTDLVVGTKPKSKYAVSRATAEAWLEEASFGKELFIPLVSLRASQAVASEASVSVPSLSAQFGGLGALFGVMGGMFTMTAQVAASHSHHLASGNLLDSLLFLGVPGVIAGLGSAPFISKSRAKHSLLLNQLEAVHSQGLRSWLKARYGLVVTDEVLKQSVVGMLEDGSVPVFEDVSGREWVLRPSHADGSAWLVDQFVPTVDSEAVTVETVVDEVVLPGEAGVIYSSVMGRLAILSAYSLSAESSHNVKRVREDVRQAIVTFRKWEALGGDSSGEDKLVVVLSALNEELLAIVNHELATVGDDLTVQGNYLKSRQLESGIVSGLSMNVSTVETEKEVVVRNV